MSLYRTAKLLGFTIIGLGCSLQSVRAGISGADLSWQFYAAGSPYNPGGLGSETSGTFIANGSVGGTFIAPANGSFDPVFTMSADNTGITFDFSVNTATGPFSSPPISGPTNISNGVVIDILSGGSFDNVTIDGATNMAGFSVSAFSFNTGQLDVDFAGLPFSRSTIVKLDVTSGSSLVTPEPATGGLLLASLAGAIFLLRRKTRTI
jgi:hypothetical protein